MTIMNNLTAAVMVASLLASFGAQAATTETFTVGNWNGSAVDDGHGVFQRCLVHNQHQDGSVLAIAITPDSTFQLAIINQDWPVPQNASAQIELFFDELSVGRYRGTMGDASVFSTDLGASLTIMDKFLSARSLRIKTDFDSAIFPLHGAKSAMLALIECLGRGLGAK